MKDDGMPCNTKFRTRSGEHLCCFLSKKKKSSHPTQGEEMTPIKNVSDLF